jgi:hypothetical protein
MQHRAGFAGAAFLDYLLSSITALRASGEFVYGMNSSAMEKAMRMMMTHSKNSMRRFDA